MSKTLTVELIKTEYGNRIAKVGDIEYVEEYGFLGELLPLFDGLEPGQSRTVQFAEMGEPAFTNEQVDYLLNAVKESESAVVTRYCSRDYNREEIMESVVKELNNMKSLPRDPVAFEIQPGQRWVMEDQEFVVGYNPRKNSTEWFITTGGVIDAIETDGVVNDLFVSKELLTAWLAANCTPVED